MIRLKWECTVNSMIFKAVQTYDDLSDVKGRTPGHAFLVSRTGKMWRTCQQSMRAGTYFGAIPVNTEKEFDDLDEAKSHCEAQAAKALKAVYKNKQFTKKTP